MVKIGILALLIMGCGEIENNIAEAHTEQVICFNDLVQPVNLTWHVTDFCYVPMAGMRSAMIQECDDTTQPRPATELELMEMDEINVGGFEDSKECSQ